MAITKAVNSSKSNNYNLNSLAAENFRIITGSWSVPSTYVTGGVTADLAALGFGSGGIIFAKFLCTQQPVAYSYSDDAVLFYSTSATDTTNFTEVAADTELTTSGGYFVVLGYGAR